MSSTQDSSLLNSDPGSDPLVGTVLDGTFEVKSQIGKGGMGCVYKAHHRHLDRPVAVKVLRGFASGSPVALQRFRQEARALSSLSHPNIVSCHRIGFHDGNCFIAMDLIEGTTLGDEIELNGTLSIERFRKIFQQVLSALEHAHQRGIVHRDLKPENIMLVTEGNQSDIVRIVDFGIAKLLVAAGTEGQQLTKTGALLGSPLYMSPELCRGAAIDYRTDFYSLGCLMYYTLCGKPPFEGADFFDIIRHHTSDSPPQLPEHIPASIDNLIGTAMEKEPADRFATATDMLRALQIESKESIGKQPRKRRARAAQTILPIQRLKVPAACLAVLSVLLLSFVFATTSHQNRMDELERALTAANQTQVDLLNTITNDPPANRPRPPFPPIDWQVFDATDKLLQARVAYANSLLDEPATMDEAILVANELDSDLTRQQSKTKVFPLLQSATVDGIAELGLRLLARGQSDTAARCIVLALVAYHERARFSECLHSNPREDIDKLLALHAKAKDMDLSSEHRLKSLARHFGLTNRPRAYVWASKLALAAGDRERSKLFAGRAYASIDEILTTGAFSKNEQGLELIGIGLTLLDQPMNKEALSTFQKAGVLCRKEKSGDKNGAPTADYYLALASDRLDRGHTRTRDVCALVDTAIASAAACRVNTLPACVLGANICAARGDLAGARAYRKLALEANHSLQLPQHLPAAVLQDAQMARGKLLLAQHNLSEAREYYEQLLKATKNTSSSDEFSYITTCLSIGTAYRSHDLFLEANSYFGKALAAAKSKDDYEGMQQAYLGLNETAVGAGRFGDAKTYMDRALQELDQNPVLQPEQVATLYWHRSNALYHLQQYESSLKDAAKSLQLFGSPPKEADLHRVAATTLLKGVAHSRLGQFKEAEAPLRESVSLYKRVQAIQSDSRAPLSDVATVSRELAGVSWELAVVLRHLDKPDEAKILIESTAPH